MTPLRPVPRFILAGGLALVIAGLAWLMFGIGGWRGGLRLLPDADGSRVEVLSRQDPGLTLEDVLNQPASAWHRWPGDDYVRAEPGGVIWLRASLKNPGGVARHGVFSDTSYFADRVDAWLEDGKGSWRSMHSGDALSGAEKPLWGRRAAFPVDVPAGGETILWLRVSDAYIAHLQPWWWPSGEDFYEAQLRDVLAECICYGALAALFLYNVVLWLRLRFPDTGYYLLYAGMSTVFNFVANGGCALLGLGVGSPWKEMTMAGLLVLAGVFVTQFARVFLGTAALLPKMDRWLRRWRTALVGVALGVPTMPWWTAPHWLSVTIVALTATHVLCLAVAITCWRRGVRHARFFVAAFGLLFAGISPAVFTWLQGDVLAGAAMAMLAGATLEMLLLSFAVADRFAQTQQKLVEETEQRRMIEETYADELAIEVRERTRELADANADKDRMLAVVGHDLRSPLTGLMRLADETPGEFAREASRIGRGLLLLIEDLVLWARLRAGTRLLADHPASAVTAPAVALHRALADQGGIELAVAVAEDLRIRTDLVLAQTLVRNLLANALKFARTRVSLQAVAAADGEVRFAVANDGPSLSLAVAERFAAGEDEPMTATGGLGLRLCREICRALGTRLEARSCPGTGTEFYFTLKNATVAKEEPA